MTEPHNIEPVIPAADFVEKFVEADGFRIRYVEAGTGEAIVCLHGGGGLRLSGTHDILAAGHRVIAFEVPGFGQSPVNDRSKSMDELAATMNAAVAALGVERYDLMGTSFGSKVALTMALLDPERVPAIVLISPAAIRLGATTPPTHVSPAEAMRMLYRHPERQPKGTPPPPGAMEKHRALTDRLLGPPRDAAFEARLAALPMPVLVLFGTADPVTPPAGAHLYREALPNCHIMMVYDAAHAIDGDRPEAASAVIDDFLRRHEQFLVKNSSSLIHP
jgi:4,5:9,10-diseco-3-hydroxy-5,9,17-trioxoandrosta-1(10),2-diene-4-oate hydrolase